MTYAAKIIADSIAEGVRLTTMEIVFPRIVLAEFNTHRMFSRNSASSRAIPVEKRIAAVRENPFVPESFGKNQKGMQAAATLDEQQSKHAEYRWREACHNALYSAKELAELGVHKQLANRILEPFSWHTVVCTATDWANYFNLRVSSLAQPEIRRVSELMRDALDASTPKPLERGEWHTPYVSDEDVKEVVLDDDFYERSIEETVAMISAARCARVSYLTHDGKRDIRADITLAKSLAANRHMSPFEHTAYVETDRGHLLNPKDMTGVPLYYGNFRAPWKQLRKLMDGEAIAPAETP